MTAASQATTVHSRRWLLAAGLLISLVLIAVAITLVFRGRRHSTLSEAEAASLEADANVALAELENQALDRAIPLLETVRDRLPEDPFSWRNLAVARVVALGNVGDMTADADTIAAARLALDDARRHEEPDAAHEWLGALILLAAGDPAGAVVHYERLTRKSTGDDASKWYALSRALRAVGSAEGAPPQVTVDADRALDEACGKAPLNLWLAVEWLRSAAARLSGEMPITADLSTTIGDRWRAIAPFAASVKTFARTDARALLDEAVVAIQEGDRGRAAGRLRAIANVLVPQSAADRSAIERHPLEFVRERFSDDTLARLSPAPAATGPIEVTLDAVDEIVSVEDGSPVAILLEDIDLDGANDLLVLFDRRVRCYSRAAATDGPVAVRDWQEILTADVPPGARGLIAADLDLDFDEARRLGEPVRSATDPRGTVDASLPAIDRQADALRAPDETGRLAAKRVRRCPAADLDLVVFGANGVTCLENRGPVDGLPRRWVPYGVESQADDGPMDRPVRQLAVADLDGDGRLDLVVAGDTGLSILGGRGQEGFVPLASGESFPPADMAFSAILPIDFDRDVDIDLVLGGPSGVGVLENLRYGQFRFTPMPVTDGGIAGLDVVDGDGSWRVVTAGPAGIAVLAADRSAGDSSAIAPEASLGLATWDYDNDGHVDLACWGDDGLAVLRGLPGSSGPTTPNTAPRFKPVQVLAQPPGSISSFDAADLDGDGDLDAAITAGSRVVLLDNRGGNANHWITIDLEAQQIKGADLSPSGRVNAHGLGSLLELKAGSSYQPRQVRRRSTHFGLGNRPTADVVRVSWINGVPQNLIRPPVDTLVCEQQILLGSCPYLYARGESGFSFVTDLLWAAPIGLQRADGVLMPARDHEWIKVPGAMVATVDGRYELEITEELWEAAYFDHVRLVAVDHPAEVTIWSNEKVGPEEIAAFGVHTVREARRPAAARDDRGRDLLTALASADGRFARPWNVKYRQGLVERHAMEIDLGPPATRDPTASAKSDATPVPVTLFLTGWTYPTTVSLNVALSRDPSLGLPAPPSLSVPDGRGGWRTAIPFMGFPGGKTKTIAIDLTHVIPPDDPRVRIDSSMEIHWDEAFFTRGEQPAAFDLLEVPLASAVLRHRGYSRIVQDSADGPERFLHDEVSTEPKWPPMLGSFTRYGDVRELLADADDRLVVMGAGDAMRLSFEALPPPRPGWERDFLLHSIGWDKDANLATAEGQTVEPLPFRGMQSYPPAADDPPPNSPLARQWLDSWQTRSQTDDYYRHLQRTGGGINSKREREWVRAVGDGVDQASDGVREP